MENYQVAEALEEVARLMELHGENPFKIRSYQNAAFKIDRLKEKLAGKTIEELAGIDGIGKSLSHKIHLLIETGTLADREALIAATPEGVIELMHIKGIGPKKVALLWKELDITSPGELLYACNENRLLELKGFGKKSQDSIRAAVTFKLSQKGFYHYAAAEISADAFIQKASLAGISSIETTGDLRRKCEIVQELSFICDEADKDKIIQLLSQYTETGYKLPVVSDQHIQSESPAGIPITITPVAAANRPYERWRTTGNDAHILQCLVANDIKADNLKSAASEEEIYRALKLPFIEPEMREGFQEVEQAVAGILPRQLINVKDLKGILHNHSTYSDGINSLEEMAFACRDMGYSYLGICDHSKSAQYAGGLSIEKVAEQQEEIKRLNEQLAPFRIFSGIESDILADGSLDYPDEILSSFDFIVASVHSGLKMEKEKATERLLTAIRNPHTTILGHPTGRLLLSREGYPIDHDRILKACGEAGVVVELNAHPYRLDLDWRWIHKALAYGVLISINPDAHSIEGYNDMYYGVCCARKAGLTAEHTFNAKNLEEISLWFKKRKEKLTS